MKFYSFYEVKHGFYIIEEMCVCVCVCVCVRARARARACVCVYVKQFKQNCRILSIKLSYILSKIVV